VDAVLREAGAQRRQQRVPVAAALHADEREVGQDVVGDVDLQRRAAVGLADRRGAVRGLRHGHGAQRPEGLQHTTARARAGCTHACTQAAQEAASGVAAGRQPPLRMHGGTAQPPKQHYQSLQDAWCSPAAAGALCRRPPTTLASQPPRRCGWAVGTRQRQLRVLPPPLQRPRHARAHNMQHGPRCRVSRGACARRCPARPRPLPCPALCAPCAARRRIVCCCCCCCGAHSPRRLWHCCPGVLCAAAAGCWGCGGSAGRRRAPAVLRG
jgi:hypothetical protein